jgi:hypothetical protein
MSQRPLMRLPRQPLRCRTLAALIGISLAPLALSPLGLISALHQT